MCWPPPLLQCEKRETIYSITLVIFLRFWKDYRWRYLDKVPCTGLDHKQEGNTKQGFHVPSQCHQPMADPTVNVSSTAPVNLEDAKDWPRLNLRTLTARCVSERPVLVPSKQHLRWLGCFPLDLPRRLDETAAARLDRVMMG